MEKSGAVLSKRRPRKKKTQKNKERDNYCYNLAFMFVPGLFKT